LDTSLKKNLNYLVKWYNAVHRTLGTGPFSMAHIGYGPP